MIKIIKYEDIPIEVIVKDKTEHIQKYWMGGHFYETQRNGLLNYIYQNYKGGTFIDCGASIGNHTLFFAKICKADYVYAFEPVLESCRHLIENINLNNIVASIYPIALGNRWGKIGMKPTTTETNNVGMFQVDEQGADVVLNTLDNVLQDNKIDSIKLIKIDVEHYNCPLLEGAECTLEKYRPDVFIECESEQELTETELIMKKYHYKRVEGLKFNHTPTYMFKHE